MTTKLPLYLLSALTFLPFLGMSPQAKELVRNDFRDDMGGWVGIGQSAKTVLTKEPTEVGTVGSALKMYYFIEKGQLNALVLPVASGALKEAKSVKLRLRADFETLVAVSLQEEEGGRYVALVHVPKNEWQTVELSTGDFGLAMDKGDPKDPNGRLDMDRVTSVFVADVAQFLAQVDAGPVKDLFNIPMGGHTLLLGDFTIGTEAILPRTVSAGADVRIDTFDHPQLAWYSAGGAKLTRVADKPLAGPGFMADYRQSPGKFVMFTTSILPWVMTTSKTLSFDVASTAGSKLIVQLEENEGGKYNTTVEVPSGSERKHFRLPLSALKPADDSKDPDGKLDPGNLKSLVIIDAAGALDKADRENTLWLGNLVAEAAG